MFLKNNDILGTISTNLELIINAMGMKQKEFCEYTHIPNSTLSNYLTAKTSPDSKSMKLLFEAGINISYLFDNENYKMFADNTKGRLLANKYEFQPYEKNFNKRLESWIIINYECVKHFCNKHDLSISKIYDLITKYLWEKADYDFAETLTEYGLNIKWLFMGSNNMFADNKAGEKLRKKLLGIDKIELQNQAIKELKPIIMSLHEKIAEYTAE